MFFVKCTLCVYVHILLDFFFSARLQIKCHVTVDVTNTVKHLYDDIKVIMISSDVETCHVFVDFFQC